MPGENRAIARSKWDAPEIDGTVVIDHADGIKPGDKVTVTVTGSGEYDLFAVPAANAETPAPQPASRA